MTDVSAAAVSAAMAAGAPLPYAPTDVTDQRLETLEITLSRPITHDGVRYTALTLTEPRAGQLARLAEHGEVAEDALIASMAGVPVAVARRIPARHALAIGTWQNGLTPAEVEHPADDGDTRTFELLAPLTWRGERIESVVAGEPTLGGMSDAAKAKSQLEQGFVLAASAIDRPPGLVMRMAARDVMRIMAFIGPFLEAAAENA